MPDTTKLLSKDHLDEMFDTLVPFDDARYASAARLVDYPSMVPKWNENTAYREGDLCLSGGRVYYALRNNAGVQPATTDPDLDWKETILAVYLANLYRRVLAIGFPAYKSTIEEVWSNIIVKFNSASYDIVEQMNAVRDALLWLYKEIPGSAGFFDVGTYSQFLDYKPGNLMEYNQKLYVCTNPSEPGKFEDRKNNFSQIKVGPTLGDARADREFLDAICVPLTDEMMVIREGNIYRLGNKMYRSMATASKPEGGWEYGIGTILTEIQLDDILSAQAEDLTLAEFLEKTEAERLDGDFYITDMASAANRIRFVGSIDEYNEVSHDLDSTLYLVANQASLVAAMTQAQYDQLTEEEKNDGNIRFVDTNRDVSLSYIESLITSIVSEQYEAAAEGLIQMQELLPRLRGLMSREGDYLYEDLNAIKDDIPFGNVVKLLDTVSVADPLMFVNGLVQQNTLYIKKHEYSEATIEDPMFEMIGIENDLGSSVYWIGPADTEMVKHPVQGQMLVCEEDIDLGDLTPIYTGSSLKPMLKGQIWVCQRGLQATPSASPDTPYYSLLLDNVYSKYVGMVGFETYTDDSKLDNGSLFLLGEDWNPTQVSYFGDLDAKSKGSLAVKNRSIDVANKENPAFTILSSGSGAGLKFVDFTSVDVGDDTKFTTGYVGRCASTFQPTTPEQIFAIGKDKVNEDTYWLKVKKVADSSGDSPAWIQIDPPGILYNDYIGMANPSAMLDDLAWPKKTIFRAAENYTTDELSYFGIKRVKKDSLWIKINTAPYTEENSMWVSFASSQTGATVWVGSKTLTEATSLEVGSMFCLSEDYRPTDKKYFGTLDFQNMGNIYVKLQEDGDAEETNPEFGFFTSSVAFHYAGVLGYSDIVTNDNTYVLGTHISLSENINPLSETAKKYFGKDFLAKGTILVKVRDAEATGTDVDNPVYIPLGASNFDRWMGSMSGLEAEEQADILPMGSVIQINNTGGYTPTDTKYFGMAYVPEGQKFIKHHQVAGSELSDPVYVSYDDARNLCFYGAVVMDIVAQEPNMVQGTIFAMGQNFTPTDPDDAKYFGSMDPVLAGSVWVKANDSGAGAGPLAPCFISMTSHVNEILKYLSEQDPDYMMANASAIANGSIWKLSKNGHDATGSYFGDTDPRKGDVYIKVRSTGAPEAPVYELFSKTPVNYLTHVEPKDLDDCAAADMTLNSVFTTTDTWWSSESIKLIGRDVFLPAKSLLIKRREKAGASQEDPVYDILFEKPYWVSEAGYIANIDRIDPGTLSYMNTWSDPATEPTYPDASKYTGRWLGLNISGAEDASKCIDEFHNHNAHYRPWRYASGKALGQIACKEVTLTEWEALVDGANLVPGGNYLVKEERYDPLPDAQQDMYTHYVADTNSTYHVLSTSSTLNLNYEKSSWVPDPLDPTMLEMWDSVSFAVDYALCGRTYCWTDFEIEWTDVEDDDDFSCKGKITCAGMTADMLPEIILKPAKAREGGLAGFCESKDGYVEVFSTEKYAKTDFDAIWGFLPHEKVEP